MFLDLKVDKSVSLHITTEATHRHLWSQSHNNLQSEPQQLAQQLVVQTMVSPGEDKVNFSNSKHV